MSIIQDDANSVAHLTCRLRDLLPDRQQYIDDIRRRESPGRNIAQFRKGVTFENSEPLPCIDGALPACRIFLMILVRCLAERHLGGSFILPFDQNIATVDLCAAAIRREMQRTDPGIMVFCGF